MLHPPLFKHTLRCRMSEYTFASPLGQCAVYIRLWNRLTKSLAIRRSVYGIYENCSCGEILFRLDVRVAHQERVHIDLLSLLQTQVAASKLLRKRATSVVLFAVLGSEATSQHTSVGCAHP